MGAHLRPLNSECSERGCRSAARVELRNTYNAILGRFCQRHGKRRLRDVLDGERGRAPAMQAPRG